jgi:hypothetical protein
VFFREIFTGDVLLVKPKSTPVSSKRHGPRGVRAGCRMSGRCRLQFPAPCEFATRSTKGLPNPLHTLDLVPQFLIV